MESGSARSRAAARGSCATRSLPSRPMRMPSDVAIRRIASLEDAKWMRNARPPRGPRPAVHVETVCAPVPDDAPRQNRQAEFRDVAAHRHVCEADDSSLHVVGREEVIAVEIEVGHVVRDDVAGSMAEAQSLILLWQGAEVGQHLGASASVSRLMMGVVLEITGLRVMAAFGNQHAGQPRAPSKPACDHEVENDDQRGERRDAQRDPDALVTPVPRWQHRRSGHGGFARHVAHLDLDPHDRQPACPATKYNANDAQIHTVSNGMPASFIIIQPEIGWKSTLGSVNSQSARTTLRVTTEIPRTSPLRFASSRAKAVQCPFRRAASRTGCGATSTRRNPSASRSAAHVEPAPEWERSSARDRTDVTSIRAGAADQKCVRKDYRDLNHPQPAAACPPALPHRGTRFRPAALPSTSGASCPRCDACQ